jgi:hypothetical protein
MNFALAPPRRASTDSQIQIVFECIGTLARLKVTVSAESIYNAMGMLPLLSAEFRYSRVGVTVGAEPTESFQLISPNCARSGTHPPERRMDERSYFSHGLCSWCVCRKFPSSFT